MTEPKASDVNNDLIIYRLDEIKDRLDNFQKNYVTKEESHQLRNEIAELRNELHAIKKRGNLLNWIYPSLSAAFSTIFTLLIIAYLNSKR